MGKYFSEIIIISNLIATFAYAQYHRVISPYVHTYLLEESVILLRLACDVINWNIFRNDIILWPVSSTHLAAGAKGRVVPSTLTLPAHLLHFLHNRTRRRRGRGLKLLGVWSRIWIASTLMVLISWDLGVKPPAFSRIEILIRRVT